jgi:hypothetical protein
MYVITQESGHVVWKERWYALMSKISLRTDIYMIQEDHVFIANVVVTNPMWETMALSVISQPTDVVVDLSTIVKICKYRGLHEGHHFIPMAMEVHGTPWCNMDHFIRECVCLFQSRRSRNHLFLSFYIQFFKHHVNIALQHALAFAIERKIVLASDACFRPPITIKSHDLHAGDIRGAMGEIASSHLRD